MSAFVKKENKSLQMKEGLGTSEVYLKGSLMGLVTGYTLGRLGFQVSTQFLLSSNSVFKTISLNKGAINSLKISHITDRPLKA